MLLANAFLVSLAFLRRKVGCRGRVVGRAHAALEAVHVQTMDVWVASLID